MTKRRANKGKQFFHFYQLDLDSIQQFATKEFKYLHLQLEAKVHPIGKYIVACDYCQGTGERKCSQCKLVDIKGEPCSDADSCVCLTCHGGGYLYKKNWSGQYLKEFEQAMLNRLGEKIKDKIIYYNFVNGFFDTNMELQISIDYVEQLPEIIRCFQQTCLCFSDEDVNWTRISMSLSQHCKA